MKRHLTKVSVLLALVLLAGALALAVPAEKVVICHHNLDDASEPEWVTIEVAASSVDAHLAHGDQLGACEY